MAKGQYMHRTIIVGSPRSDGRCAHLAQEIFDACIDECPEDGVSLVSVSSIDVSGCMGCYGCKQTLSKDSASVPAFPEKGDPLEPQERIRKSDSQRHVCVIADDMPEVRKHLDAADELIVVSPVYFASAPAQLKALLDRLQPYYWSGVRRQTAKRPLTLHVVGEGGDPHGIEPLIGCIRSAFSVAGFKLCEVLDWRGKIDEQGNVLEDAQEYEI